MNQFGKLIDKLIGLRAFGMIIGYLPLVFVFAIVFALVGVCLGIRQVVLWL